MLALVPAHSDHPGELGPITVHSALTTWALEPVPAAIVLVVGALYVTGVVRLRRRGDRWSPGRTLSFLVGLATIVVATQSFLAVYDLELLSVHMVQHMVLSMVSPVFLALGAPITLALRTLPKGGRALLMRVVHSRFVTVLTFPLVAMALFVVNPWVLYFTPFYEATLRNPLLHDLNHLHLLLVGCLWFWALLGIDPLPNRPLYPMRVVAVLLTLPFHAFLGVTIMGSTQLIAANWYLSLDRALGSLTAGRPADRGRDPVGDRGPRRGPALRGPERPVGAGVRARGARRRPAARPAGGPRRGHGPPPERYGTTARRCRSGRQRLTCRAHRCCTDRRRRSRYRSRLRPAAGRPGHRRT